MYLLNVVYLNYMGSWVALKYEKNLLPLIDKLTLSSHEMGICLCDLFLIWSYFMEIDHYDIDYGELVKKFSKFEMK